MRSRWTIICGFLALLGAGLILLLWGAHVRKERQFEVPILAAARKYQVDPALVKAVVWRESRFDALARGAAGELGLMQLREAAAGEWANAEKLSQFTFDQLRDPVTNTMAGTWYLSRLLKRYVSTDDPVPYALADYNAGRTHVLRWNTGAAATNSAAFMEQITFPGTRNYIQAVAKRRDQYRAQSRWQRGR
ncbi:MAG: lytic transglycosylase domain-containing protein [Verrucomicrobia bacterium]|nr:lytic transglycosylase domain-containing protein [Verrucomicrobiota bacterium]